MRARPASNAHGVVLAGVSRDTVCGVRDHNRTLVEGFAEIGIETHVVWVEVPVPSSVRATKVALDHWAGDLAAATPGADGLLLQFSVFSHSWRGFPVGIGALARAMRRSGVPVLLFLHEPAYQWSWSPRASAWAMSHRAALRPLVAAASSLAVTTEPRAEWIASRRWLPSRRTAVVPVSSTLPKIGVVPADDGLTIALLGHGSPAARPDVVLEAAARLLQWGVDLQLTMIGAPGPESAGAVVWRRELARLDLESRTVWTGVAEPEQLAWALGRAHVGVFTDERGPSGRRTSVAGALALGVPVVGFDGPEAWPAMAAGGAVTLVAREVDDLATALRAFAEPRHRGERSLAATAFSDAHLRPDVVSARLLELLGAGTSAAGNRR